MHYFSSANQPVPAIWCDTASGVQSLVCIAVAQLHVARGCLVSDRVGITTAFSPVHVICNAMRDTMLM